MNIDKLLANPETFKSLEQEIADDYKAEIVEEFGEPLSNALFRFLGGYTQLGRIIGEDKALGLAKATILKD